MMKQEESTITGYVTPTSWDSGNHITAISLVTNDQEEIHINFNRKTHRLLSLVWEKVEVTGRVTTNRRGEKMMAVEHYRPADDYALIQDASDDVDELDATEEIKEVVSGVPWVSGQDVEIDSL